MAGGQIIPKKFGANLDTHRASVPVSPQPGDFSKSFIRAEPSVAFPIQAESNNKILMKMPLGKRRPRKLLLKHQLNAEVTFVTMLVDIGRLVAIAKGIRALLVNKSDVIPAKAFGLAAPRERDGH